MDSGRPLDVLERRWAEFVCDVIARRGGLLPLSLVELLLREVETVSCLVGIPLEVVLRVLAEFEFHSSNASWGLRICSGAFPFCAAFFSFFSMSLTTALRLRAPLADIVGESVQNLKVVFMQCQISDREGIGPGRRRNCRRGAREK